MADGEAKPGEVARIRGRLVDYRASLSANAWGGAVWRPTRFVGPAPRSQTPSVVTNGPQADPQHGEETGANDAVDSDETPLTPQARAGASTSSA